jgi:hypothetical protein
MSLVMTFDNRLSCFVNRLEYDFTKRSGKSFLLPGNCCDGPACIKLFEAIDPEVKEIQTFEGANVDTLYWRRKEEWHIQAARQGRRAK